MGLLGQGYEFPSSAPSYEAIWRAVCQIEGAEIPMCINHAPPDPKISADVFRLRDTFLADHPEWAERHRRRRAATGRKSRRTFLFTRDSMRFTDGVHIYLGINVSLDGDRIFVCGNIARLFKCTCAALQALGGTSLH
jgi:hypothetical protein